MKQLNWYQKEAQNKSRERLTAILAMRERGLNSTEIAKEIGTSRQRAHQLLKEALRYESLILDGKINDY